MKIKALMGFSLSAIITLLLALWFTSLEKVSEADGKGYLIKSIVTSLNDVNVAAVNAGILKYILLSAPVFGLIIVIARLAEGAPKGYERQLELFDTGFWETVELRVHAIFESLHSLACRVEAWMHAQGVAGVLEWLNGWVFVKFSSTIVGSFCGFLFAALLLGEFGFARFLGYLLVAFILYMTLMVSFFWHLLSHHAFGVRGRWNLLVGIGVIIVFLISFK
ncbi:hypothetical protein HQN78_07760 [Chromobacterium sp. Beijing]|nr:hypothetical protein HQN78_07760 [Chromobacterium sp. Beijing]